MIFGKVNISPHAIKRYKQRIMTHRHLDTEEQNGKIITRMLKEIDLRNTIKTVTFGEHLKFIFTHSNTEFRFERSSDKKKWIMVTCVRYSRLFANEEPLCLEELQDDEKEGKFGIRTAILVREKQKIEWEKTHDKNGRKIKRG